MTQSFGTRMRQQREERGIDLIAIAEQTKIKRSLLEALERDDVSRWPSGIFRRAFIRAYAHAIGLDPDAVVREFLELYPEPADVAEDAVAALASADDGSRNSGGPPTRLRYMMGTALASLGRLRRGVGTDAVAAPVTSSPVEHGDVCSAPVVEPEPVSVPEAIAEPEPVVSPPVREVVVARPPEPTLAVVAAEPTAPMTVVIDASPDLLAIGDLVTRIGRVARDSEVEPMLPAVATLLDASGLIVWVWDDLSGQLMPTFAHGYSPRVLAQLPPVSHDADNATAAAFRSARTCEVRGAIVVPLLTASGCRGVLAIELQEDKEQTVHVRGIATILAAAFAQVVHRMRPSVPAAADTLMPAVARFGPAARPMKVRR